MTLFIQRINNYPVDRVGYFINTYPVDSFIHLLNNRDGPVVIL